MNRKKKFVLNIKKEGRKNYKNKNGYSFSLSFSLSLSLSLYFNSLPGLLLGELVSRADLVVPRVKPPVEHRDPDRRLGRVSRSPLLLRGSVGERRGAGRAAHLRHRAVHDDLGRPLQLRPPQDRVERRLALGALGAELGGWGVDRVLDRVGALGLSRFGFFFLACRGGSEESPGSGDRVCPTLLANFDDLVLSPSLSP